MILQKRPLLAVISVLFLLMEGVFTSPALVHAATIGAPTDFLSINKGLVAWWTFNGKDTNWSSGTAGTVADLSGNGKTGTLSNMSRATSPALGKLGQALKLDGVDDYVQSSSIDLTGTNKMTESFWGNFASFQKSNIQTILFSAGTDIAGAFVEIDNNAHGDCADGPPKIVVGVEGDVGFAEKCFTTPSINAWHHYVAILDKSTSPDTTSLYIDGVLQTETSVPSNSDNTNNFYNVPIFIGDYNNGSPTSQYTDGKIDDVRIYNRVLSASEVLQLYNLGGAQTNATPQDALKRGLAGWWTMDGKNTSWSSPTAGTVSDSSGNGNTGTMNSMDRAASPVLGRLGQAMNFSTDVNARIDVGKNASINNLTQKTITAWIKPRSFGLTGNQYGAIFEVDTGSDAYYYWLLCNNDGDECGSAANTMIFLNKTTGTYGDWSPPANSITLNQWQFVAVSYDCSSIANVPKMYINGASVAVTANTTASGSVVCDDSSTDKNIGNGLAGGGAFDGAIDDVRLYSRILSDAEIRQLYSLGQTAQGATPSTNPTTGSLKGWWTFDGPDMLQNARDKSGQGNKGNLTGFTSTTTVLGKLGQALSFNGSSQYVTMPSTPAPGSEVTVSAWIKPTGSSGSIVYRGDSSCCLSYRLLMSSGIASFGVATGPGGNPDYEAGGGTSIDTSGRTWTLVTGVYSNSGNLTAIYVNGALDGTDIGSGTVSNSVGTTNIGAQNAASNYFPGAIDDVRVYGRALSATEIRQLYNQGR